jgi:amidohydrolase
MSGSVVDGVLGGLDGMVGELESCYVDLHQHPELSFQETRTAAGVARRLEEIGCRVSTGVGRTGVVGVLDNGRGPAVLLRADMDALPVAELTGLPYASTVTATDGDGRRVPVMHACGHDMHVSCLIGACRALAENRHTWSGTLMVVFQPAEEIWAGARAMVDDGLFERFGRPDIVLGQHVTPFPAGLLALHPGIAHAAADNVKITMVGKGGHGGLPETSIDPVVMAAATIMRLQTVVSREVAGADTAVVTVGVMRAGTKANIIPDQAELLLSVRTVDDGVRSRVLDAITRIARAEAAASGATEDPQVQLMERFPAVHNDQAASARTRAAFTALLGEGKVIDPGLIPVSEDVGLLPTASGAPCVFWLLGGADPTAFTAATSAGDIGTIARGLPVNHSPLYAPVIEPTLSVGIAALVTATQTWLPPTT